jgi:xanthine dehydrogenase D subunit
MAREPILLRAATSAEAARMAADRPAARLIAGGTAIQLEWAKGAPAPDALIDLSRIAGRSSIGCEGACARIGAQATLGAMERDAELGARLPLLAAAVRSVAGPSVRNLATIGGNVAGRAGCLLPALLALDAVLEGVDAAGAWRERLEDWLARPARADEVIDAVEIPLSREIVRWTQRKVGLRAAFTPSIVGVAGLLTFAGGRIAQARLAVGGGVVAPTRLAAAEARLAGISAAAVDWPALREALFDEIVAPDDALRSGRYRRRVAANALVQGLGGTAAPARFVRAPQSAEGASRTVELSHGAQPARWHIRPDGPAKIAGSLRYLTDHRAPDMLVGRILRAGRPHARILSIDTSRAEALPGVAAVVTHRDVPGLNAYGIVVQDQPAFCFDKARHAGDPVAAVAATDAATAEAALALIDVVYEPLPTVTSPEQALAPDAPLVHETGNLQRLVTFARGDVDAAFADCAHELEDVYVTPRQMHGFMETEGGWAEVGPDGALSVHVGGQHGARDRLQLSRILAMPEARIRVVTSPTGGGFGGKDELTVQPALALLALKSGRPVRLQLSRAESVLAGLKRNPMTIRMRTGCDAEGRLLAQEVDVLADAGAYASLGPGVLETALEHAAGPYDIAHVRTRGRLAYTNNGLCGAFRGFGANQMAYAMECQMDRLAQVCGLSPIEIRRRNLRRPGTPGSLGQTVAPSERLDEMLAAAAADPLWRSERGASAADEDVIGVGMAMNYHGNGLGSVLPDPGGGALRLAADGRIEAAFGLDEMGQGLLTAIVSTVSDQLGCGRDDVRPAVGDTAASPDSGSTTASRGTFVVWNATRLTAPRFSAELCAAAGAVLGRAGAELKIAPGGFVDRLSNSGEILLSFAELARAIPDGERPDVSAQFEYPKTDYLAGNARFLFVSGACVARVAVNRVTGQTRVLDLNQHAAAGPILDVAAFLGQQEGGAVQGLGFTLFEDAAMREGAYLAANLDAYMLPSVADAPARMSVRALEDLDAGDPYGPRGAGELGIGAVTPAIANAVADAIGYFPTVTPFPPEALLDAMERRA